MVFPYLVNVAGELVREAGSQAIKSHFARAQAVPNLSGPALLESPPVPERCPYCFMGEELAIAYWHLKHALADPATSQGLALKHVRRALERSLSALKDGDPSTVQLHRGLVLLDMQLSSPRSVEQLAGSIADAAWKTGDICYALAARYNGNADRMAKIIDDLANQVDEHASAIERVGETEGL